MKKNEAVEERKTGTENPSKEIGSDTEQPKKRKPRVYRHHINGRR